MAQQDSRTGRQTDGETHGETESRKVKAPAAGCVCGMVKCLLSVCFECNQHNSNNKSEKHNHNNRNSSQAMPKELKFQEAFQCWWLLCSIFHANRQQQSQQTATTTATDSRTVLGLCKKSAYVVTSQADKLRFFGQKQAGQSTQLIDSKSKPKSILNVSHIVISLLKTERWRW